MSIVNTGMTNRTRDRDEDGQFTPEVDDSEFLAAIDRQKLAGTSDIGDAVGLARQNADYRLRQLVDQGLVDKKKIGGTLVWSLTDSGEEATEGDGEASGLDDVDPDAKLTVDDIGEIVKSLDIQGSDETLYPRYRCLAKVLLELRKSGSKEAGELKSIVRGEYHGFDDPDSFWANTWRRDALPELTEIGLVEEREDSGEYHWVPVVGDGFEDPDPSS